jgi:hypothetical protein
MKSSKHIECFFVLPDNLATNKLGNTTTNMATVNLVTSLLHTWWQAHELGDKLHKLGNMLWPSFSAHYHPNISVIKLFNRKWFVTKLSKHVQSRLTVAKYQVPLTKFEILSPKFMGVIQEICWSLNTFKHIMTHPDQSRGRGEWSWLS